MTIALVSGTFTAAGQVSPSIAVTTAANLTLSGAWTGTVSLQRSFDDGLVWHTIARDSEGAPASWTGNLSTSFRELEGGVLYRLRADALATGTCSYRISQ